MIFRCQSEGEDVTVSSASSIMKRIYFKIKPQTNVINMEYGISVRIYIASFFVFIMFIYFCINNMTLRL